MNEERNEYLNGLVDDYGVESEVVFMLADLLGEEEDFDGLLTALEDFNG